MDDMEYDCRSLEAAMADGWQLLDIRTAPERAMVPLPAEHRWVPMDAFFSAPVDLGPEKHLVICAHGVRSLYLTQWLRNQGINPVSSLRGGLAGLGIGH